MPKPVIGIVAKPNMVKDMWHYMDIVDELRYTLVQNGALAVGVLPTDQKLDFKLDEEIDSQELSAAEKAGIETIIARLDGVILEGGLVSSKYEEEFVKASIAADLPTLGICSGFNNLVRALGGTVHIDESIFHNQFGARIAHNVEITPGSRLHQILQATTIPVNSIHTCIAHSPEIKGYTVVAKCPDDQTIEAIELPDKKFVMGIKWHPEFMPSMKPIFEAFIAATQA